MAESAAMFGDLHSPGQYFVLIRWHPGYMSAPHWYETDRLCVKTPHYDGVKKGGTEPAIIAISGIGPITYHLTDPAKPGWREV
jgi:hypothetical protein